MFMDIQPILSFLGSKSIRTRFYSAPTSHQILNKIVNIYEHLLYPKPLIHNNLFNPYNKLMRKVSFVSPLYR